MSRPKPKFAWIEDPKNRKTVCQQRMKGLMRKNAEELTILCETSACLLFFSRDDNKLVVWLTREDAKSFVEDYYALPENQTEDKESTNTKKMEKVVEELELDHLIFQLENGKMLIALSQSEIENLMAYVCIRMFPNPYTSAINDPIFDAIDLWNWTSRIPCPRFYLMDKWFLKTCERGESSNSGGVDDDDDDA